MSRIPPPWVYAAKLPVLIGLYAGLLISPVRAVPRNITISSNSSQILYTPFICNATTTITNPECNGAWQLIQSNDNTTVVSTQGPGVMEGEIVPQMFIRFQGSFLFIQTGPLSNATANVTISAGLTSVNLAFNSSAGGVAVVDLIEAEVTTATLTFIDPEQNAIPNDVNGTSMPSRLDIEAITITVDDDLV
ncbi:hypothetical protein BDN72DRAFT_761112 [Pluteus cervinus]|uniref:Uncharacterized protein n=1 Tax=Pluteus cervinus TaxID=181527 RepID=A0ACD3B7Q4_9AGAR|nr:hypothetical protein BDN72DRAFT_761112 [Pluteus cervinus]